MSATKPHCRLRQSLWMLVVLALPWVTCAHADPPADVPAPYAELYDGLDWGRFSREYRDMVHLVVRELHPDFLGLITEPDTHAHLTGLREFEEPQAVADLIRSVLAGHEEGRPEPDGRALPPGREWGGGRGGGREVGDPADGCSFPGWSAPAPVSP